MKLRTARRQSLIRSALFLVVLVGLWYALTGRRSATPIETHLPKQTTPLPCSELPLANDTVVALKTSVAEIEAKLPIHFNTTLLCYPNYLIFSDWKEAFNGHPIIDALDTVSPKIRETSADFELWRRVQKRGPDVLEDDEIWNSDETTKDIDKWKWLPMINRTFVDFPDKKWYVFLESDTYVFWISLLTWLGTLESDTAHYIGAPRSFEGDVYAHGSAGIVLSHKAVMLLVQYYGFRKDGWESYIAQSQFGDTVVGRVLAQFRMKLKSAWPLLQLKRPAELDYSAEVDQRRLWCYPSVSHSGLSAGDVAELWKFDKQWVEDHPGKIIRHSDVFNSYIMPRLQVRSGRVDDWDNFSGDFKNGKPAESVDVCREMCVADPSCVQFSFFEGQCEFSSIPRLGSFKRGVRSRWMLARAQRFIDQLQPCGNELWIE